MKRIYIQTTRCKLIILTFILFLACFSQSAHSQSVQVAILLQQLPSNGGSITPTPGVHRFDLNTEVTLTAVPQLGYQFIYWIGDVTDPIANRTTAYINKPKIIIALFDKSGHESPLTAQETSGGSRGGRAYSSGDELVNSTSFYGKSGFSSGAASGSRPSKNSSNYYTDKPSQPSDKPYEPPIPEPATAALLVLGSLFALRKRFKR